MKRFLFGWFVVLLAAGAAFADKDLELTVAAGESDRVNDPVCVELSLPLDLAKTPAAVLVDPGGNHIPAQLTEPGLARTRVTAPGEVNRDLHFLLPKLAKGQTITLKTTLTAAGAPLSGGFSWSAKAGEYEELRLDGRPVLRYMNRAFDDSNDAAREQTYKVFHHLFDPAGQRLVTKGPGGQYTHHRGLFYGFNKVSYGDVKLDIWHCPKGGTHQAHEKTHSAEAGPVLGRHRVLVGWYGPGKKRFALEERELTAYRVPGGSLVEFASRLRSEVAPPIKLDGDPQHAGFHFRADNEVSAKTKGQTYYLRPDGKGSPGQTRNWPQNKDHVNLPWDVMSFVLGEQRYSVAYLDRPTNPKEARFSERDYGRFGSYFAYELTKANPLVVAYRVWLQEGEMTGPQAAHLDACFVRPVRVTVK
jgi:hypothetical protein